MVIIIRLSISMSINKFVHNHNFTGTIIFFGRLFKSELHTHVTISSPVITLYSCKFAVA
jgi:hypothetical protein